MLEICLTNNNKAASIVIQEDTEMPRAPILDIYLGTEVFSIPLETLRGKLNELEMQVR